MNDAGELFGTVQQWLFERAVQPAMFGLGLGNLLEEGYSATGWLLVGVLEIAIMLTALRALERWRPVEVVTDRAAVRVDVIYTLIHRLGLLRLVFFFTLEPLWERLVGRLHVIGVPAFSVDNLWPGVSDIGWVSLLVYVVLFDAADYAIHRAQHRWHWWWQLHALHHSQRQMTLWSDNRNHLLDSLLRDSLFALLALMVGVPPAQFVAVVVLSQLMESLSHANVRLSFGPLFERVFVSPRYHRLHHAMSLGSEGGSEGGGEGGGEGRPGGHNFAVLLPLWDLLAGTARFDARYEPTGLSDQLQGRDYGRGFWSQQWLGLRRLVQS